MPIIQRFSSQQVQDSLDEFVELLQNVVHNGSSVGFLPPLASTTAEHFWRESATQVATGERVLLAAVEEEEIAGSVQLALSTKQNGLHRAEVQKLIVHTRFRNRGIARGLMKALEEVAQEMGRTLLFLDTEAGSAAEKLYPKCGYVRAGTIPQYALATDGSLIDTVVFYKLL